ncbi:hypothetical protein [Nitrosococcus watsonii]
MTLAAGNDSTINSASTLLASSASSLPLNLAMPAWVWNTALAWRGRQYRVYGKSVSGVDFSHQFTFLKGLGPVYSPKPNADSRASAKAVLAGIVSVSEQPRPTPG